MGKSDVETFYEELANFKKKLGKDNKERCADSAVTERKQSALKCLVKKYNEKIRLEATTLDLRVFDEKIRFIIKDSSDILRNRQQCTASVPELQDQRAGINLSTFIPSANSTGLSDSFTRRRSLTRSPSSSSATSQEDPLQTTIIPAEDNDVSVEEETDTTLTNKIIQAKPRQSRQQTHSQGSVTEKPIGTIIMTFANTTVGNARGQTIEPIRPQFIQPPSFRPAYHSPTAFLLGYERAACGNGWNDGLKISHLGSYLEGTAVRWYHNYLLDPANDTKTWDEVKRDFKNEFMEVQWGSLSNDFYYKQQGYTEDIGRYYYDLRNLADELNQNMPFEEFRAQFEKGLHPRFRPNYYMLREKEMSQAIWGHSEDLIPLNHIVSRQTHGTLPALSEGMADPPTPPVTTPAHQATTHGKIIMGAPPHEDSNGITSILHREGTMDSAPSIATSRIKITLAHLSQIQEHGMVGRNARIVEDMGITVAGIATVDIPMEPKGTQTGPDDFVLDTGAGRSIIREDMVTSVDSLTNKVNLVGAGGSRLLVTGTHAANIEFGSVKISATLLVARHLSRSVILGNDFLDATLAIINYRNRTINLEVEGKEIEFPFTRIGTRYSIQKPKSSDSHKQQVKPSSIQRPTPIFPIDIGEKETQKWGEEIKLRCPQDYTLLPNRSIEILFTDVELSWPDQDSWSVRANDG
ncbi:hypothetical protein ABEB36_009560 [Hypothenemus hampei]|uniref:Peptidase A2 domain-containing protein n=1 Tax=Hypothenemus hampei TaxID=57062 RepID=A0ABD1EH83_HYPHA